MDEKKESFKHVSVDYPTDYSTHAKFVLFDFDKFDKWLGRLVDAHEREVREHTLEYDIDGLSDRELAEHGLVRLPVDADGVLWTGEEQYATFDGSEYNVECLRKDCHGWMVQMIDLDGKQFRAPTELCRHVPDVTADQHAELADELESLADGVDGRVPQVPDDLRDIADRLRQLLDERGVKHIVRCRDCTYVTDEGYGCKYFSHYEQGASYRWEDVPAEVKPDGFCAWGERKERTDG